MAFNKAPTSVIAGWTVDGANVSFPLASLTQELTAAEAEASGATGDWREILFSFVDHFYNHYNNLDTADKPLKTTISKNGSLQSDGTYNISFSITFKIETANESVANET